MPNLKALAISACLSCFDCNRSSRGSGAMGGHRCRCHRTADPAGADHGAAIGDCPCSTAICSADAPGHERRPRHGTNLLAGTQRNYLPSNWTQIMSVTQGQGTAGYTGLSADVQSAISANAVLSPQQLSALSPADQRQIQAARQWSAVQQAVAHEALANASGRFAAIQSLIAAIPTAVDQKASLDLQARISAELGMLQNEQTKLQVLFQATQAQESALRQQARELVIAGQGSFATRFQPVP